MALNPAAVGAEWETSPKSWTSKDALLYALGVGVGIDDPFADLEYSTENSHDVPQRVLPTFAAVLAQTTTSTGSPDLGDLVPTSLLHAEQSVRLYRPLPTAGTVRSTSRIVAMHDKGRDGVIVTETESRDAVTAEPLYATSTSVFVRGGGGFGGKRGETSPWPEPESEPDRVVEMVTRPDQALLYRLSGDRNPLHSDPVFAAKAGFDRPISHGMCTFGITGRALLAAVCDNDPARFGELSVRFSKPTYPGRTLRVAMWIDDDHVRFRTYDGDAIVLDRGVFRWANRA